MADLETDVPSRASVFTFGGGYSWLLVCLAISNEVITRFVTHKGCGLIAIPALYT